MEKKLKFRTKHPIDYSKHLPEFDRPWTKSDRALYNLIYSFGVNGCWMSNKTIGPILHRCRRTIQLSRRHLQAAGVILCARTNPRTWSMWSARHPAVVPTKILFFRGGEMRNPAYLGSGAQKSEAQKLRPGGAMVAPKRKEHIYPEGICSSEGPSKRKRPSAALNESQGASPPNPPAVHGSNSCLTDWQKSYIRQQVRKIDWKRLEVQLEDWKWSPAQIEEAKKLL